jgi:hypothetical protein
VASKPYSSLTYTATLPHDGSAGEPPHYPLPVMMFLPLALLPPLWSSVVDPLADAANAAHDRLLMQQGQQQQGKAA